MKPGLREKQERFSINIRLFAIKVYGIVISCTPCKIFMTEAAGVAIGFLSMWRRVGQWREIAKFARHIRSTLPQWRFLIRYFIQKGKDLAWEVSTYEAPLEQPEHFFTIEGKELLDKTLSEGKGAVLLGAHYGPLLYLHTLDHISAGVKVVVAPWRLDYWQRVAALGAKPLRRKMFDFLSGGKRSLAAGKDEKALIAHLRAGGAVFMEIDNPGPRTGEQKEPFLGLSVSPHYFPFELSLRYGSPVLFCLFEKCSQRPYRFRISACRPFTSPAEGFKEYTAFVERSIISYPFMWSFVPHFFVMFS